MARLRRPKICQHFDKVFCIHLPKREDRLRHMERNVAFLGVEDCMEYWPAQRTKPGRWGAALSHAGILRAILENGWERTLVLEDDVIQRRARALTFIGKSMNDASFDVFYLGATFNPKYRPRIVSETDCTYRVLGAKGAFAVVYTPRAAEAILPYIDERGVCSMGPKKKVDIHYDRLLEQVIREHDLVARVPRKMAITHKQVGRSDTAHVSRPQRIDIYHFERWWDRLVDKWRASSDSGTT